MAHIIRNAAPPTELLRRLGRTLEDFQKDSRYLGEHRQALTQQYPDEWVVILDCKVVGHHPDADELRKAMREQGVDLRTAPWDFLATEPQNWRL